MMQLRMQKKIWGGNLPESRREKQNCVESMPNVHPLIIFSFFAKTLLDINSLFLREAEAKEYEDEDEYVEYSDEDEEDSDEDEDEEEYDEEGKEEEFEDDEEYDSEEFEDDAEGLFFRGKLDWMVLIKLN